MHETGVQRGVEAREERLVDVEVVTSQHALAHHFARQQLAFAELRRQVLRLKRNIIVSLPTVLHVATSCLQKICQLTSNAHGTSSQMGGRRAGGGGDVWLSTLTDKLSRI